MYYVRYKNKITKENSRNNLTNSLNKVDRYIDLFSLKATNLATLFDCLSFTSVPETKIGPIWSLRHLLSLRLLDWTVYTTGFMRFVDLLINCSIFYFCFFRA